MTVRMAVVLTAGIALNPASPFGSTQTREQLHFNAEDEKVERAIVPPPGVLAVLRKDPDVVTVLDAVKKGGEIPEAWVMASEVHLNAPTEKDIVVVAAGPLAGANVTTFWVFRPVRQDFQLLMKASAHDLEVKNTRSGGYRDIEILFATGTRVSKLLFRFDGLRYRAEERRPK